MRTQIDDQEKNKTYQVDSEIVVLVVVALVESVEYPISGTINPEKVANTSVSWPSHFPTPSTEPNEDIAQTVLTTPICPTRIKLEAGWMR